MLLVFLNSAVHAKGFKYHSYFMFLTPTFLDQIGLLHSHLLLNGHPQLNIPQVTSNSHTKALCSTDCSYLLFFILVNDATSYQLLKDDT